MSDRPILMSAPMVRALLGGRKTQTRRVCKAFVADDGEEYRDADGWPLHYVDGAGDVRAGCRYGLPGDRLWVRETWAETDTADGTPVVAYRAGGGCIAVGRDGPRGADHLIHEFCWPETPAVSVWRPSIHMPRWASRITLEVTEVRVQRVQDISDDDVLAEGTPGAWVDHTEHGGGFKPNSHGLETRRFFFRKLWADINGRDSFDANPWVWAINFRRVA